MSRTRRWMLVGLLVAGFPLNGVAQMSSSADHVRSLYRTYLNREPSSNELTQWVWAFQKGVTLAEAQVTFLSADEYFARFARNPTSFVTALYADVLNRAPSAAEVSAWVERLTGTFRGDREKLVREFLTAVEQDAAKRAPLPAPVQPPVPAPPVPPSQPISLSPETQLTVTARLVRDELERELGGTAEGQRLLLVSRSLIDASSSLERVASPSSDAAAQAYQDVRRARAALDTEFRGVRPAAPHASAYLDRFDRLLGTLRVAASQPAALPAAPPARPAAQPPRETAGYPDVRRVHTILARDTEQLLYVLRNMANPDAQHTQLLRDIEFFSSQLDALDQSLRWDMPYSEVRSRVLRLRALGSGISELMRRQAMAGQVVQRWNLVAQNLQQLCDVVGFTGGLAIDPGQAVLYNAPTYHQLPYQVQRPTQVVVPADAAPAIDQAVAQLNAFVVGFNQFLPYYPQVPGLQSQARRLRLALIQFRQQLTGGGNSRELKSRLAEINQQLQSLHANWRQTIQATGLTNAPDFSDIVLSVQKANQVFLQGGLSD